MTPDNHAQPLSESVGTGVGPNTTQAFGLLGDPTRLAILLALWEADDPRPGSAAVSFTDLRKTIGMQDSGQFNYHLKKLEETFVNKTSDRYSLRPVGLKLIQTVIADTGQPDTLPPTEIDVASSLCSAATAITYQDGWLYHVCTECPGGLGQNDQYPRGTLFSEPFPAAALTNRTAEEVRHSSLPPPAGTDSSEIPHSDHTPQPIRHRHTD